MVRTMTNENRELSIEELDTVTGCGIVDTVRPDAETRTSEFLKNFSEASVRFNAFINAGGKAPAASQE